MKNKEIMSRLSLATALTITAVSAGALSNSTITTAAENDAIVDEYNPSDDLVTTEYGVELPYQDELTVEEQELVNSIIEQLPSVNNKNAEEVTNNVSSTFYGPVIDYNPINTIIKVGAAGTLVAIGGSGIAIAAIKNKKDKEKEQKSTEENKQ